MGLRKILDLLSEYKCYVMLFLILINILVFAQSFLGQPPGAQNDIMIENGAVLIREGKLESEVSSLFQAMFLHFNFEHLFNNMVVLFFIGSLTEKYLGSICFGIVYLFGGIGGNIISAWNYMKEGTSVLAAGASGAVFAVIGAMLCLVIFYSGRLENMTLQRVILFIALSLYEGFTSEGIDNYAHVGGLVIGFFICLACCLIKLMSERSSNRL